MYAAAFTLAFGSALGINRHFREVRFPDVRRICVFAGSSSGTRPVYSEVARALGCELARRGLGLVYGGASRGLMGVVADAALAAGRRGDRRAAARPVRAPRSSPTRG